MYAKSIVRIKNTPGNRLQEKRRRLFNRHRRRGRKAGHDTGFSHGYHLGRCESVRKVILSQRNLPFYDAKILYVTSGIEGPPYKAIDSAIVQGFRGIARELVFARPGEDIAALAALHRPAALINLNGTVLGEEVVRQVREMGVKTAVWFADDPYYTDLTELISVRYDHVFTLESNCVPFYRSLGCPNVHYLPLAVNPEEFLPKLASSEYRSDVCFIGSAFWNRVPLFDALAPFFSEINVKIVGYWWYRLRNYKLLKDKIVPHWLSPDKTARYYHGAKIAINVHRSVHEDTFNRNRHKIAAHSVNPRTFEISSCGALQLTDERLNLPGLYEVGSELDVYASAQQLVEKIRFYMKHEDLRQEMALRGLRRTLRDHTYASRLSEMLGIILE